MIDINVHQIVLDNDQTFDPLEADHVVRDYVCAVCHAELIEFYIPGDRRILVSCPEHGNVTRVGRVMRSTVSIEMENASRQYLPAIRALPDLWGELIPPRKSMEESMRDLGF